MLADRMRPTTMTPMLARLRVGALGLGTAALFAACRTDTTSNTPEPAEEIEDDLVAEGEIEPSEAATPAVATPQDPMVAIDLSPSGIGASIRGPDGARAKAEGDYVVVEADPDFHMTIHRGPIDVLATKADIVRRWGPAFERYVQDDDKIVIYETQAVGDTRFHFFTWGEVSSLQYHCTSDKRGAETIDAVRRMIDGCHAIEATKKVGT